MKLKKILALGLAAAMTASLAACGGASSGGNSGSGASAGGDVIKIGVLSLQPVRTAAADSRRYLVSVMQTKLTRQLRSVTRSTQSSL